MQLIRLQHAGSPLSACTVRLAGNHEAWALQDQSLPHGAAALIERWSVAAQRDGILAVHGSPHNPLMGRLSDEQYVREALRRLPGWLCAHGHTHQAALWLGHRRSIAPGWQALRYAYASPSRLRGCVYAPQPRHTPWW